MTDRSAALPRWVMTTWHLSAVFTACLLVIVAALSWLGQQSSSRTEKIMESAVVELRVLNRFFDSTLVAAQRRSDSLRAIQQRRIDSLEQRRR